jgi:hypothetical protein
MDAMDAMAGVAFGTTVTTTRAAGPREPAASSWSSSAATLR